MYLLITVANWADRNSPLACGIVAAYVAACLAGLVIYDRRHRRRRPRAVPPVRFTAPDFGIPRQVPPWVNGDSPVRTVLNVSEMIREMDQGEPVIDALLGEIRLTAPPDDNNGGAW